MTEEDKILINAYLDNEASVDEIKYVELLFSKDEDALNTQMQLNFQIIKLKIFLLQMKSAC